MYAFTAPPFIDGLKQSCYIYKGSFIFFSFFRLVQLDITTYLDVRKYVDILETV